jgi:hypothetical protein
MEFFNALEDMQFATPNYEEVKNQWIIRIDTDITSLSVECSTSKDNPSVVVGLIDSDEGLTYFQSQQLYHWYQKYSHRWLMPESDRDSG